jgi:hypothetical protein
MKTITDLKKEFMVENGIIKNPGKFEGEPLSTPFYYDLMINGIEGITIEPSDRIQFPNIPGNKEIAWVTEDENGFANVEFLNNEDINQFEEEDF